MAHPCLCDYFVVFLQYKRMRHETYTKTRRIYS